MFVSSLGGCSPTAGPMLGRRGRTQSSQAAFLRVGPNVHGNRSCICGGDRHAATLTRRAYTLTSDTAVTGSDVRSADLNDMCTLQLGMLYQLLSRTGNNYSSMRCTVYARNFTSVGPGQVKLVRVAQFPVSPGQSDDVQTQQQLLLHTEQSWALQGGSAAVDPSAMIEDCLRHREVVALPSSSCLVFPLVDCAVLVGLLVVEMQAEADSHWEQRRDMDRLREGPGQQQEAPVGAQPAGSGGGRLVAAGGGFALTAGPGGGSAAQGGDDGLGGRAGLAGVVTAPPSPPSSSAAEWGSLQARPRRSLTDEELQCLRLAVPLLAKACGMDARASWQLAQSSVSAAAAQGLLREAQRPLSTLNTFGAMLLPRLKDGDPDKDMAKGILVQGKRLQDLMWQLEDALHGPSAASSASVATPPGGLGPAGGGALQQQQPPFMSVAVPGLAAGAGGAQNAAALPATPFRSPSGLPRDPSPAVQELLSLPPPRPAALPAAASQQQPQQQQPTFSTDATALSGSLDDAPAAGLAAAGPGPGMAQCPPPVSPGRVTFVDRSADAASASTGGGDGIADAFTIRQPPAQPSLPASGSGRGGLGPATQPGVLVRPDSHRHPHQHQPQGASTATIDVEMEPPCDSRKPSLALAERPRGGAPQPGAGGGAWGWGPANVNGDGAGQLTAPVSTNLASALAGVLTAAYRLAAVSGIGFIVNSPLSAVLPRRVAGGPAAGRPRPPANAGDGAAAKARPALAACDGDAASSSSSGGAAPGPRLIPRPARPLLVGVHGALVQKVVGYMLDIALQCTPRGGQVCVSARQDGAGVQVQLLHSGRMDLQRLHVRSRSLAHHHTTTTAVAAPLQHAQHVHPVAAVAYPASAGGSRGGAATALATRPAAVASDGGGGDGAQAGSGVLSVEIAQELAQQAGGHLTVSYPFNMVNARSGSLDVGTSVEIWLPGPGTAN